MRLNMCWFIAPRAKWILKEPSRGMTPVSSEASTARLPSLLRGGPLEAPWSLTLGPIETLHLYPVRLSRSEESWRRNGYAACVSRAKEARKAITLTNVECCTFPRLFLALSVSLCVRTALLLLLRCLSRRCTSMSEEVRDYRGYL